jgi:hypothetical protein
MEMFPGNRPFQFGLRSMFAFTLAIALVLALCRILGIGFGIAFFAMGFFAFMAVLAGLLSTSSSNDRTVYRSQNETDAVLRRDYLCLQGINAQLHSGELPGFTGLYTSVSEVVVPMDQAARAEQLLAEQQGEAEEPAS